MNGIGWTHTIWLMVKIGAMSHLILIDIELYDKLAELLDLQAEDYIHRQLLKRQQDSDMLTKFQAQLEQQLAGRFVLVCQAVERLTNKPLFLTEYHFLSTTFPRLPSNYYDHIGEVFNFMGIGKIIPTQLFRNYLMINLRF